MTNERPSVTVVPCLDLDEAIEEHEAKGFRLDALGPADEPTWAALSSADATIWLDADSSAAESGRELGSHPAGAPMRVPQSVAELAVEHEHGSGWVTGRAGMRYRDLVPDRWGGAYIASHIHVPTGGPVPDYVHHHDIAYQLIFCHRGWVTVVYQDQGPPFTMQPGDCVLQPPGIRHQVLESSDDLYVVEITCPAEHRTSLDHDLALPTDTVLPDRSFGGQRFVHHRGELASWAPSEHDGFDDQRTAIADATDGLADVRLLRPTPGERSHTALTLDHEHDFMFLFVLSGAATLRRPDGGDIELTEGSSVAVPPTRAYELINITPDAQLLRVASTVAAT